MNLLEHKMLENLAEGKKRFGFSAVKAEFEAEGTRVDELLRLVEITRKAGLKLVLKISGCEAIRDLIDAKKIGVDYIVAPMIETPFALSKYINAKNRIYNKDEQIDTTFLFNIETITAYNNLEEILLQASIPNGLQGVVFGRVDFSKSLGFDRNRINTKDVTNYVLKVGLSCKNKNLDFIVGGDVSISAVTELKTMFTEYLTRFETRKIVFDAKVLKSHEITNALFQSVSFELMWLQNKKDHYGRICIEDLDRIQMLEKRLILLRDKTLG